MQRTQDTQIEPRVQGVDELLRDAQTKRKSNKQFLSELETIVNLSRYNYSVLEQAVYLPKQATNLCTRINDLQQKAEKYTDSLYALKGEFFTDKEPVMTTCKAYSVAGVLTAGLVTVYAAEAGGTMGAILGFFGGAYTGLILGFVGSMYEIEKEYLTNIRRDDRKRSAQRSVVQRANAFERSADTLLHASNDVPSDMNDLSTKANQQDKIPRAKRLYGKLQELRQTTSSVLEKKYYLDTPSHKETAKKVLSVMQHESTLANPLPRTLSATYLREYYDLHEVLM